MSKALVSELLKRLDWEIRTNRLLAELNNYLNLKDSLRTVLKHLREITDCEALGIRLYDGKNYPYYAYEGLEGV
ncbi:MAG: histidine kinase, partial [Desulfitobacteriia bacterium]